MGLWIPGNPCPALYEEILKKAAATEAEKRLKKQAKTDDSQPQAEDENHQALEKGDDKSLTHTPRND